MRIQRSFIGSKYNSLFVSGTLVMVLMSVMGMLDTLIAGIILGEEGVAAICLVLPVYSLASFFVVCFSYGVPILYASKTGAFQREEANRCFGVGLTVACAIGLVMFAAVLAGGNAYLDACSPDPQTREIAREYLSWMKYAILLLPVSELLDGMLFADGDENISLAANLVQGAVKVALSVILCRSMGAKGLAIASLACFAASILMSFLHFFRPGNTLKLNLAFSPAILWDIIRYGLVDASTYLFLSLFTFAVDLFVIFAFGPEMLVLVSVIALIKEGQIFFEGIGEAITPLVSVYYGEKNHPGIRKIWKYANRSLWAESLLATAVLLIFAPQIVGLLGIRDPATAEQAVLGLRLLSLSLVFTCRLFLDSSYFILVEKIPLGVFDSFLRDLFPALPLAVLGGLAGGVTGFFIGLAVAPLPGYLLSVWYIRRKYGRENYALFLADMEQTKKARLYDFAVSPETVVRVRDEIGAALKECACPDRLANRVCLTFEELFMLIYDSNPGKTVLAECLVEIGDTVRLITKDNGRIVDLTDADRGVDSLRAYALSSLLEAHTTRRAHFLALSFNHNMLEIR